MTVPPGGALANPRLDETENRLNDRLEGGFPQLRWTGAYLVGVL
jgi:hypothetical protein